MSKLLSMRKAIADLVPDGASVCINCKLEQMIPFAAGHEIIRQKKRRLTIYGVRDVNEYAARLGDERVESLGVKQHAYAAAADFGY